MKWNWFLQLRYFLFWLIFFLGTKIVFLLYHWSRTQNLSAKEISQIFLYGLRLDASFTAYLSIIPFFCIFLQSIWPEFKNQKFINFYTKVLLVLIALLTVVDLELYQAWNFRLDITPLQYLATPNEILASAGNAPVLLLFLLYLVLVFGGLWFYRRFFLLNKLRQKRQWADIVVSFWFFAFLIVPMRGGFQQIPINQSDVYFSNKTFANHVAVNLPWNLMYSVTNRNYHNKNPYKYFPDATAKKLVNQLYTKSAGTEKSILNNTRPNILFIILESYTGKLVGCLGGEPGVTPNLDQLAREGILFDSIYASGDRSEKGVVALLSSYPVQTTTSIIKTPRKTENLPHLNQILETAGYASRFYYGGELAFANIKSYLINAGYDILISKNDFKARYLNSKWGVHDHVLLQRVLTDLNQIQKPFFTTVFTLSSHEPYDIPIPAKFRGTDEPTQFKNSVYYTDYALGQFIAAAKKQSWWNNTLIVLAADHGHRFPGNDPSDKPSRFRIPFILTGGALAVSPKVVSVIGSQTDIGPTVLAQMNLPAQSFTWSKNLLNPEAKSFAFYVFNDGFGFVTKQGAVTFDNVSKRIINQDPLVTSPQLDFGKAYMQESFQDFLSK